MDNYSRLKLFFRQSLDQMSEYDLVDGHNNAWQELKGVEAGKLQALLQELEGKSLSSESKELVQNLFISAIAVPQYLLIKVSGVFSLISLLVFLPVDALLVPDVFWLALSVKLFLVAPLSLYSFVIADWRRENVDVLVMLSYVLTQLLLVGFMLLSSSPLAWVYGYGISLVCMSATIMQCLPTKQAGLLTLLSILFAVIGFSLNATITVPVLILSLTSTVFFCLFALVANYRLEIVNRRQYVSALHEKLRVDSLTELNKELNERALKDSVTGIGNRRFLDGKLSWYYTAFSVSQQPLGVLMIDVDHFKLLNDKHGHVVGDACLRRVAETLASGIRSGSDLVARYGGEEFVIVLPGASPSDCFDLAERLRKKIEKTAIVVEGAVEPVMATVSIGCHSAIPIANGNPVSFIEHADAAVYVAKRNGRNQVCLSGFPPKQPIAHAS